MAARVLIRVLDLVLTIWVLHLAGVKNCKYILKFSLLESISNVTKSSLMMRLFSMTMPLTLSNVNKGHYFMGFAFKYKCLSEPSVPLLEISYLAFRFRLLEGSCIADEVIIDLKVKLSHSGRLGILDRLSAVYMSCNTYGHCT